MRNFMPIVLVLKKCRFGYQKRSALIFRKAISPRVFGKWTKKTSRITKQIENLLIAQPKALAKRTRKQPQVELTLSLALGGQVSSQVHASCKKKKNTSRVWA